MRPAYYQTSYHGSFAGSAAYSAITAADLPTALLDVDTASPTGADALYVNLGFAPGEREVALVRHL